MSAAAPSGRGSAGRPGRPGGPAGGPGSPGGGGGPMGGLFVPTEKSADFVGTSRRLLARLRPYRIGLIFVISMTAFSVLMAILGPKLLGNATTLIFNGYISGKLPEGATAEQIEAALRAQGEDRQADMLTSMDLVPGAGVDFTALRNTLILVALVYLLSAMLGWAGAYLMAGITQQTIYQLRADVDAKIGRLPLSYFDSHARGDLLSRVTNDIDNISNTLQQVLTQLITSVLTVVGVLGMMFWIDWILALIALLTVPLSLVVTTVIAKRSQKQFIGQWQWTGELNGHVEQMLTGHDLVKVYGQTDAAIARFEELNDGMYQTSFKAQFISGVIQPAMMLIGNINYVAIAVIGGMQVAAGSLPIGDVQAFIQYSRQFQMPITQIAAVANLMQSGVASAERVFEFLDATEQIPDPAAPVPLDRVEGRVEFSDLHFRYLPDKPLISGLNLSVAPGESVAIVGPTGAGKTTLVNLLLRFYEIDSGSITLDGVDTRRFTRDELRSQFGMVLQDTWLFNGTISENIAYGAVGETTEEEILAAAKAASVDHFVRTLADGYDTVLDDGATNVSAGEKQLITIARAFMADPAILILDEATSSVDTRTEVLVQKAMARLREGRTSFVIAHRLSTIRDADTILVMKDGAIVEQGNHAALMQAGGAYAELYQSQFAEAIEG